MYRQIHAKSLTDQTTHRGRKHVQNSMKTNKDEKKVYKVKKVTKVGHYPVTESIATTVIWPETLDRYMNRGIITRRQDWLSFFTAIPEIFSARRDACFRF